jgi:hypothetical protein
VRAGSRVRSTDRIGNIYIGFLARPLESLIPPHPPILREPFALARGLLLSTARDGVKPGGIRIRV